MSLRSKTISGVGWTSFARVIKQGAQFILSVILMRLLNPDAYGLIGMAMVFIGFANIFKEFGFGSALVQRSHLAVTHYSSTYFTNIVIGILICVLFLWISPLVADFYGDSRLNTIVQVLSINFALAGFGIVPRAFLQRKMRFDILSKIDIAITLIPGTIAVILAFLGWGVWSLVFQSLVGTFFSVVAYNYFSPWKPRLDFSFRAVKELWSYSANLTGFNVINYWARKSDDLLIGKFMGSASLGIYSRAYSLMLLPITQIISVISGVMFPALSKIQREKERVKKIYLRAMRLLAFITFPMMIGLFVVAQPFVLALFGEKWIGVIPIIQILTWVGITQTLSNPTGWIYTSQGKTNWMFWWGVFGSGTLVIAIVIGVWVGSIKSVAMAYLVANILLTYPGIAIPGKLIDMRFWDVIRVVYPSLAAALGMAVVVFGVSWVLPNSMNIQLRLGIEVLTGILVYVFTAIIFKLSAFQEFRLIGSEYIQKVRAKMG
jgi:PST family polysaccharide transporter